MDITKISQLNPVTAGDRSMTSVSDESMGGQTSFASMLQNSVGEVNDLLMTADKKASELAMGKTENLHEAMIATEKAETALKFLVQVRNKALDAYHEVMRMQV
jgi:flagellar hook-basal body complex protein FliE